MTPTSSENHWKEDSGIPRLLITSSRWINNGEKVIIDLFVSQVRFGHAEEVME